MVGSVKLGGGKAGPTGGPQPPTGTFCVDAVEGGATGGAPPVKMLEKTTVGFGYVVVTAGNIGAAVGTVALPLP